MSRHIAAMKGWFLFMVKEGMVEEDVAGNLKAPKIEKKAPDILKMEEVVKLLDIGDAISVKGEVQKHKVDYLKQKIEISIKVNEIVG